MLKRYARALGAAGVLLIAGTVLADTALSNGLMIPHQDLTKNDLTVALHNQTQSRIIVRVSEAVRDEHRQAMADAGLTLLSFLGNQTYVAHLADDADIDALATNTTLIDAMEFDPVWKLHHMFLSQDIPSYAVIDNVTTDSPTIAAYIMMHRDVDLEDGVKLVTDRGGEIISRLESINALVIHVSLDSIDALALQDEVLWIEPPLPLFDELNNSNRVITQADQVQGAPYGLDGTGVSVMVYDGGYASASHNDFGGRLTVRDSAGLSDHATHVSGTIGGDGTQSGGTYRGMAPNVTIESYGFEWGSGGIFLYSNPGDLEDDYDEAINVYGAVISNNSIGTNTSVNGFPCEITGDYGITSNLIDSVVRGGLGSPMRIVWANGNERQSSRCYSSDTYAGEYHSTAPPACAKNHITVGALNSNNDSVTSFTSWGPTDDGRIKPDVSAPGCQSNDDGGVTSTSSSGSYNTKCGTSMASPTVCGLSALLIQDYRDQFPFLDDPRNSTLKALLAHTAWDGGNPGPDYQYGYGSVRVKDAVDFMRLGQFTEQEVGAGGVFGFDMEVAPGESELKVTIAWDDAPATPLAANALVNDLDLVVIDPSGDRHYPWTLHPTEGSQLAVKTQEDHRNNIEQVQVDDPEAGTWRVEVVGTDVPEGPQVVSVTASGSIDVAGLFVQLMSPVPDLVDPATPVVATVDVTAIGEELIDGSVTLHYSLSGGGFTSVEMTPVDADTFTAAVPGATCDDAPVFYISAEGTESGIMTSPRNAPTETYGYGIGRFEVLAEDDMEVDSGWTVGAPDDDATTGVWNRMDPEGTSAQPENDHTASPGTDCWVTDGDAGNSLGDRDIDGGKTTLYSPIFELAGQDDAMMSYWRWYSNTEGASPNADIFEVYISNDGGTTWSEVETVGPSGPGTSGGWIFHEFRIGDVTTATDQIQLRFTASDEGDGSIVEAAVDDLRVDAFVCEDEPSCEGDFNGDGQRDLADLGILLASYEVDDGGDIDGDGDTDLSDLGALLAVFGTPCP
jgi:hypothetical protein